MTTKYTPDEILKTIEILEENGGMNQYTRKQLINQLPADQRPPDQNEITFPFVLEYTPSAEWDEFTWSEWDDDLDENVLTPEAKKILMVLRDELRATYLSPKLGKLTFRLGPDDEVLEHLG